MTVADGSTISQVLRRLQGPGIRATLVRGGVGSFGAAAVAALIAFGSQVLLTRLLGAEVFGEYAYGLSLVNFLATLCMIGFDTAALRFVATYTATGDWGLLRGFLRRSVQVGVGAGLAVGGVGILTVLWSADRLPRGLAGALLAAGILLPVVVAVRLLSAHLQGRKRVVIGQTIQGVFRPIALAGFVALSTWGFGARLSSRAVMLANVAVSAAAALASYHILGRLLPPDARTAKPRYDSALWTRTALPLLLIGASQTLLLSTDTLLLGAMMGTTEAGIYAVVSQLATLVTFGITAVNVIVAPMIAELHTQGRRSELQRMITLASWGVLAYGIPVTAVLLGLGGFILGLFGPAFARGWPALAVLSTGQLMIVLCGSVGFLLTMTGHERVASLFIVMSAIVNIILNLIFIPMFGMVGAAASTAISVSLRSLLLSIWVRRTLGITASALGR